MTRHAYLRLRLTSFSPLVVLAAASLLSCASPGSTGGGSGGSNGSGGNNSSGGSNGSGGSNSSGGSNGSGGSSSSGGSNGSGGSVSSGGSNGSGGSTAKGGSNGSGGSPSSGGSVGSGGSSSSGGSSGSGGSSSSGGSVGSGGSSSSGGSVGSGGSSSSGDPPGYYRTSEWNVNSVDWHGCVWTGIDSTVSGSTTSITPQDFTAKSPNGGPYEVSGSVFNDYNAVSLLGFNLNEATTGSSTQCKYNPAAATQAGPPTATIPSSATGIAVNWSAKVAPPTSFRIQIQAPDGATNAADRWCATITDAQGPSFIPFSSFYPQCWNVGVSGMSPGTAYAGQAIDAVVFLVPGTMSMKAPFDFTIVGFAPGTSKSDAPGGAAACGTITGTLGSSTAGMTASYARAAVTGTDCKEYIIQNNNWGNPTGSTQLINYTGSSFTVQSSSGSGSSAPASFPSTYIGANGNIANGTYNTWSDSGLPKQISAMQSAMTNFTWSGGSSGGDFNATYDVWFAKSPPTAGAYNDGISGFLMVWLYKPGSRQPIGSSVRTASIAGHTWNVWVGPRGNTSTGTDPASRPVISYVAQDSPVSSLSFNLKDFISDAVSHADTNNGVTGPFSSSWYLTDVFAGFEIWSGSAATNLKSTGFSCVVK